MIERAQLLRILSCGSDRAHSQDSKDHAGRCPAQPFTLTVTLQQDALSLSVTLHYTAGWNFRAEAVAHWLWLKTTGSGALCMRALVVLVASVYPRLKWQATRTGSLESGRLRIHPHLRPPFFSGSRAFPATFPSQARRENGRERERAKARRSFCPLTYPASCCATATVPCRILPRILRVLPESTGCHSEPFHSIPSTLFAGGQKQSL